MEKWHKSRKTTVRKEMLHESELLLHNVKTAETGEEKLSLLIGAMLTQTSLVVQFARLLDGATLSNSATPVMVEAMSFALWAMVNHATNTSDQVKTSVSISPSSLNNMENEAAALDCAIACILILQDITEEYFA